MPCLNEAETLGTCIRKAQGYLRSSGVRGEVVVADNGSTDGSQKIAEEMGARVVPVKDRGYGAALMGGIAAARGQFVIMGDADDSYDFSNLDPFLTKLREGYDLVMGNRFRGGIKPGAMPPLHRYFGTPVLSFIGRLFFGSPIGDFQCGLRGFRRQSILNLDLRTTGMEFASEMIVKASLTRQKITEVPTTLSPDGRSRPPHLRTWRDGWRNLRFLLMYCPRWLFLIPGAALMVIGLAILIWLSSGSRMLFGKVIDIHTMLYAAVAVILGFQAVLFAVFTKIFAISEGLLPEDPRLNRMFKYITLETGLIAGFLLVLGGIGLAAAAVLFWRSQGFGAVDPSRVMRMVIPSVMMLTLGVQIIFGSFFLSILGLRRR
ncbi:MAG: glycosyltransferase family 2 protein [Phycisphaerae bacterium]|nr:glycosyltransferase family 2 protein [Phycisphaerae bacterium]MDW8261395.1 glycosyltransferase family 2 protein [Phycisphaerales bacterium]